MFSKSNEPKGDSKLSPPIEEISAFLGKGTVFEGRITFEGVFRLDGKFEGEVFDSGTLIVGETAVVKGKIAVHTLIVNGHVEGEVSAQGRVEIHSTGKLFGDLSAPVITIAEGGVFEGQCKMGSQPVRKEDLNPYAPTKDVPISS